MTGGSAWLVPGEIGVVIFEACVLHYLSRKEISLRRAFIMSIAMNAVSLLFSLAVIVPYWKYAFGALVFVPFIAFQLGAGYAIAEWQGLPKKQALGAILGVDIALVFSIFGGVWLLGALLAAIGALAELWFLFKKAGLKRTAAFAGVALLASIAIALFYLLCNSHSPFTYADDAARMTQRNQWKDYWRLGARPISILGHTAYRNGTLEFVVQNSGNAALTITAINATFYCSKSSAIAKGLPLKLNSSEVEIIILSHTEKAEPGEVYNIMLSFTYAYQNGTVMKQYGATNLIGKYND
jgi:hypothetical protein